MEQIKFAAELKSIKDSNAAEHGAILDKLQELGADMKGLRRILVGEQGDNGLASRVRRVEEGQERQGEMEKALQTRETEMTKANRGLVAALIASGVAFVTGVGAIISDLVGHFLGAGQ